MNYFGLPTALKAGILMLLTSSFVPENVIHINIQKEVQDNNVDVVNREVTYINEASYPGIRLNAKEEDGVVWLKHVEFSNGILEFDVRGKDIKQHSFVGIAFHGSDKATYDVIYLRPFNFQAKEEPWKSRAIQYVSLPTNTWRVLREKFPGKYENSITPAPDPNAWVRMRIVVKDSMISAYINGNPAPSLVVEKLSKSKIGSIGFYVADTSGGDFANLKITKTD